MSTACSFATLVAAHLCLCRIRRAGHVNDAQAQAHSGGIFCFRRLCVMTVWGITAVYLQVDLKFGLRIQQSNEQYVKLGCPNCPPLCCICSSILKVVCGFSFLLLLGLVCNHCHLLSSPVPLQVKTHSRHDIVAPNLAAGSITRSQAGSDDQQMPKLQEHLLNCCISAAVLAQSGHTDPDVATMVNSRTENLYVQTP